MPIPGPSHVPTLIFRSIFAPGPALESAPGPAPELAPGPAPGPASGPAPGPAPTLGPTLTFAQLAARYAALPPLNPNPRFRQTVSV